MKRVCFGRIDPVGVAAFVRTRLTNAMKWHHQKKAIRSLFGERQNSPAGVVAPFKISRVLTNAATFIGSRRLSRSNVVGEAPTTAPGAGALPRLTGWLRFALFILSVGITAVPAAPSATNSQTTVVLTIGAPGEEEFAQQFAEWANQWSQACTQAMARCLVVGLGPEGKTNDHERLEAILGNEPKDSANELWLVLMGHGTFDGHEAKFNLRGPDLSATELATWLQPFHRPVAIINTASASGPFINRLSASNRVVVTATRSGSELNFAHFGQYLATSIADLKCDLDKDGQTSLLEAFLTASRQTAEFYQTEGRLATEHALLDDNGDGLGTPADWFRGIRAVRKAKDDAAVDGLRAHQFHLVRSAQEQQLSPAQRTRRDELEQAIAGLRETKSQISEDEYYRKLETLLIQLAQLYKTKDK